ncbi:MAG: hypothetical protein QME16_00500 [Planctomycetota bacterium]|nr:hypothetical protein [Planctomycetota bacterium]
MKLFHWLSLGLVILTTFIMVADNLVFSQEKEKEVGDESWYMILLNAEKVGFMRHTFNEISSVPDGTTSPIHRGRGEPQKDKVFASLREITLNKPTFLPYVKLTEEIQLVLSNPILQKAIIKMVLPDKTEITIKGTIEADKILFSTIHQKSSGEQTPEKRDGFFLNDNLLAEYLFGTSLIVNKWEVNQSCSLKFINLYNINNIFADANMMVKEKTSQKIMGVMTEGHICSLVISDPTSPVKEIEYFIGKDSYILKQTARHSSGALDFIKTSKEDAMSEKVKPVFERRGRIDPFTTRLTRATKKETTPTSSPKKDETLPPGPDPEGKYVLALLHEAGEQLQLMKDIHGKTPREERDALLVVPYQRILSIYEIIHKKGKDENKTQISNILKEADRLVAGSEKIYTEARVLAEEARNDFELGKKTYELKNLKEIPKKLTKISELLERKEVKETEYYQKIKLLQEEVSELARRSKIIEDFIANKPAIIGIVYYIRTEEIKLSALTVNFLGLNIALPVSYFKDVPESSIMIGAKTYREGDKISDDMIIKTIFPNTVIFNYKNEEIALEYKGK